MSTIYRFPTNRSLDRVVQEYFIDRSKFIGESILPFQDEWTQRVEWDELDNEAGMTPPHNMGADPQIDNRPGSKTKSYEPIPFKGTDLIKENELLRARQMGTLGGVVDLSSLIGRRVRAREDKSFLRAEWCRWRALRGALNIAENGVVVNETFPIQTYDSVVDWDQRGTATPLADFNAVKLMFDGTGAGAEGALGYINQKTLNWVLENANAADLQQFRGSNFRNVAFSLKDMNVILTDRGVPNLALYNEGYYDRNKVWRKFVEDGEVLVVGKRPADEKVGDFAMTPSLHREQNGIPAPGFFSILEVNGQSNAGMLEVSTSDLGASKNPKIEITGGVYGGPRIFFPRSVVRMTVKH